MRRRGFLAKRIASVVVAAEPAVSLSNGSATIRIDKRTACPPARGRLACWFSRPAKTNLVEVVPGLMVHSMHAGSSSRPRLSIFLFQS